MTFASNIKFNTNRSDLLHVDHRLQSSHNISFIANTIVIVNIIDINMEPMFLILLLSLSEAMG